MQRLASMLENREVLHVSAKATVREAVAYLCKHNMGAVLVQSGDEAAGVFSERDLLDRVVNAGHNPDETLVEEVMSRNPIEVYINDDIKMAKTLMHMNRVRHLLVVNGDGGVLGLVSMRDILDIELAESKELVHKLNDRYYEKAYRAKWRVSSNRVIVEHYVPQSH